MPPPQGFNSGDQFFAYLRDAFDVLYAEGETAPKMLSVGLHCRLAGRPGRAAALARFLDYVAGHDDVWVCRRVDIARHWIEHHPAAKGGAMTARAVAAPVACNAGARRRGASSRRWAASSSTRPGSRRRPSSSAPSAASPRLHRAMVDIVRAAGRERQLALIRAHPELAGAPTVPLTGASQQEQGSAGLGSASVEEQARFASSTALPRAFGFPFVMAVKGRNKRRSLPLSPSAWSSRPRRSSSRALHEIARIAGCVSNTGRGLTSMAIPGTEIMRRAAELAAITEEPGRLTRTFLTAEHRRAGETVIGWMREAGMTADFDAIGNVVGRYEGRSPGLPALLLGSHLDTVRDAGRYDGMLGVITAIACVGELNRQGVRPGFAIEVFGFGDEEGVRFQSTLLGSRAVAGNFDATLLEQRDATASACATRSRLRP